MFFKKAALKELLFVIDKKLAEAITPFIIDCINKQIKLARPDDPVGRGFISEKCICIGGEKNFKFLSSLNREHNWFGEIIPLPHPRFILQYRRKQKDQFIHQYLSALRLAG